jgi:hypothetical protein
LNYYSFELVEVGDFSKKSISILWKHRYAVLPQHYLRLCRNQFCGNRRFPQSYAGFASINFVMATTSPCCHNIMVGFADHQFWITVEATFYTNFLLLLLKIKAKQLKGKLL